MDQFEYVVVLTSLIMGLGIAQLLTGIADVLSNLKKTKLYWPHTIFAIQLFLLHIQEWWISYSYASEVGEWTLKTVLIILAYPILLFVMARMIFPTGIRSHETEFKTYYFDQWRGLFLLGLLTVVFSILHNVLISNIPIWNQIPQLLYLVGYITFLALNVRSHFLHLGFQMISLAIVLGYIVTDNTMLEKY